MWFLICGQKKFIFIGASMTKLFFLGYEAPPLLASREWRHGLLLS